MPAVAIFQGSIYDRLGSYIQFFGAMAVACLHTYGLYSHIHYIPKLDSTNHNSPLGQSHTASRHYASIEVIIGKECSLGDRVRAQCRIAYSMAQHGSYAAAQTSLAALHSQIRGTLKLEQRITAFARLIALLQTIRKYANPIRRASPACAMLTQCSPLAPTSLLQTPICRNCYL